MMKYTALLGCLGALTLTGQLMAESVSLKLKWEHGKAYTTHQATDSEVQMPQGMAVETKMSMDNKMTAKAHEKGTAVSMKISSVKMSSSMAGNVMMSFDSDEGGAEGPMAQALKPLLDMKVTSIYDKDGKFLSVEGAEELPGIAQLGMGKEMFEESAKQAAAMLPQREVKVGETWKQKMDIPLGGMSKEPLSVEYNMKLESVSDQEGRKLAKVSFNGSFEGELGEEGMKIKMKTEKMEGYYLFDVKMGQIYKSNTTMNFTMSVPGAGSMKAETKVTTELTKVEAAK